MGSIATSQLRRQRQLAWLGLAAAAMVACFAGSWRREIFGTPVFYAALARQVLETGHFAPLMHGDVPYVLKPPLLIWLAAETYRLFGINSFAATFFPRLFGVLSILWTARLGRRFFGHAAGWWAGLILLTLNPFLTNATNLRMETGLLLGMLISLDAYFSPNRWWRPWLFFSGVSLAVLSKGPPGFFPLLLAAAHAAWSGNFSPPFSAKSRQWWLASVALVPALGWYLYLAVHVGAGWTGTELKGDFIAGSKPLSLLLRGALDHYLLRPVVRNPEWIIPIVAGLLTAIKSSLGHRGEARRSLARTILLWVLVTLLVAAIKPSHRFRYLLPAYPAVAILTGREISRWTRARVLPALNASLAALSSIALLIMLFIPLPWPPAFSSQKDIARMAAAFESTLGPSDPVPMLTHRPVAPARWGRQWSEMDWCHFYLGRKVQYVNPSTTGSSPNPGAALYLVFHRDLPELQRELSLRVLARSRTMTMVRWRDDGGGAVERRPLKHRPG